MDDPPGSPSSSRASWSELLVIGSVMAAVAVVFFGFWMIRPKDDPNPAPPLPAHAGPPPEPVAEHARKVLEKFFEGVDLEDKLQYVRDAARVKPMMEDYLKRGHPFPTMGRVSPGKQVASGARHMVFFEVEPFSGPRYPVAMEWDGYRFGLDWESMTAYGTMDWPEFVAKQPEKAQTLRVYLTEAPGPLRPPDMAEGERAFRVEHRDSDQVIVAVAAIELAPELQSLVKGKRVPLTVEMSWKGRWEILRLVGTGWSQ